MCEGHTSPLCAPSRGEPPPMIPLRDENPITHPPIVTVTLIILNCLVFLYQVSLGPAEERFVLAYAAVPAELFHLESGIGDPWIPAWMTVFTSMFLHGSWLHLGGNMLYLWIFGDNIEDVMGHGRFILFYLLTGIVAVFSHAFAAPESTMPMIGASGAISGVLGAYLLLFPSARVRCPAITNGLRTACPSAGHAGNVGAFPMRWRHSMAGTIRRERWVSFG